jgi:opacity protein-like surface antigen
MKHSILKGLLIFSCLLMLYPNLEAQSRWNYGLNGGMNLSSIYAEVLSGEPLPGEFGTRISYNAGFFGEYGFNKRLFFQLGFNFDQRGFSYKETTANSSIDITAKAPYLDIPMLFRYVFMDKENYALYAMAGPDIAFLIGGRIKGERIVNGVSADINEKLTDSNSSSDFGIKAGLGAEFAFAEDKGAVFFDLRYYYGFTDQIRKAGYYENSNLDANTQVISIVVGLRGYTGL